MIVYQVKTDMKKSKKIFIGISETSGFCGRLYCGLRQMGIDCFLLNLVLINITIHINMSMIIDGQNYVEIIIIKKLLFIILLSF